MAAPKPRRTAGLRPAGERSRRSRSASLLERVRGPWRVVVSESSMEPTILPGEEPVFWACGVTPQAVALASKPPFMLTHSPGHMFITDLPNATLAAF